MTQPVLDIHIEEEIAYLTINRPDKRNAMNGALLTAIGEFFFAPPEQVKVVILFGKGGHYCSGLDLSEHISRTSERKLYHSGKWHGIMEQI